ncbi:MAG: hypothetical protein ACOH12_13745 [Parvibaculaceae bacterium]
MSDLEKRFTVAMHDIYKRADKEIGYRPTLFLQMLSKDGGLLTAKKLINAVKPSDGYTRLFEEQRLDLSVEAVVIENAEWRTLFTAEELEKAEKRLTAYRYKSE